MFTIALTGNIGSGKTTVANLFAELGVPIIDTDQLSREAVLPSSEALKQIIARFGEKVLLPDGALDRKALREIIFNAPSERIWLESLLHPIIIHAAEQKLQALTAPYAIYVVPLLIGRNNPRSFIQRILVVDVPPEIQAARVLQRDQVTENILKKILAAQASRDELLRLADDIIVNDKNLEDLKMQVLNLHHKYLALLKT
ncbi:MAG: coaE [Gammaproteobacteria bacterium]|jgi:dephospho-CoA kinase|nr:coaE [Gammaproteobacteria bacterium]